VILTLGPKPSLTSRRQCGKLLRSDTPKVSHAALVGKDVSRIVDYTFLGDMTLDKSRAAKIALNLLRLHLLRGDKPDETPA
jgi:hypothetical protein